MPAEAERHEDAVRETLAWFSERDPRTEAARERQA
jgi:hypothetical protein